jgi:hypothetical protein
MLNFVRSNYEKYIIIGDLNSKHVQFGCKENNKSGIILRDFVNSSETIIINDSNQYTYRKYNSDYTELLDLCITNKECGILQLFIEVLKESYLKVIIYR